MSGMDPRIGTWTLNVARSRFSPAWLAVMRTALPVEETAVFRETGEDEVELSINGTQADGTATSIAIAFPRQGGAVRILKGGFPDGMTIVSTTMDRRDFYATYMLNGRQVFLAQSEISRDGLAMRIRTRGTDAHGQPFEQRLFFKKQPPVEGMPDLRAKKNLVRSLKIC